MINIILRDTKNDQPLLVDIANPGPVEFDYLSANFNLPLDLVEDCMDPMHLPKFEKSHGTTMLLVRAYDEKSNPNDDSVPLMTRKLALFIGDRFLVAIHRKELPFLNSILAESKERESDIYLQQIMIEILIAAVETYHRPLERAEISIHQYEISMLRNPNSKQDWEEVFTTKSRLMVIKRMLWHIQNSVQKFVPRSSDNLPLCQDLKDRIESLHFFADSLLNNLNNLLTIQLSLASNSTNEVVRVLTLFSVIFMPLNFIVGVYGMNFDSMPELKLPYGYLGVWILIIFTALATFFWFKRRGWIK